MALHGLGGMTLGVPDVDRAASFYREFGLTETRPNVFATAAGGEQLRIEHAPYRRLLELVIAADDPDDLDRIRAAAGANDAPVADDDGDLVLTEPVIGARVRVQVRDRISIEPHEMVDMNTAGHLARSNERAPGIFATGPANPRRLGHVLYASGDFETSKSFLVDVIGFKVSDTSGALAFLRCGADHHNVGLANAPVSFLHHSSWEVGDFDEIGQGAQHLLSGDPERHMWGVGRHFLGSNLFWYFKDPCGNYAEYFSDMDQIPEMAEWDARDWPEDVSLYAWGPTVPSNFVVPDDVEEIAQAMAAG